MLLVVDVGNTQTHFGTFRDGELHEHWRFATDRDSTADELGATLRNLLGLRGVIFDMIDASIVSSTVPQLAPEWAAMQENPNAAKLVAAIGRKVATFEPGAPVLPGVTAVALEGHTPGHSAYEIASGDERLLYIGDAAHHYIVSVQRPDWTVEYDQDAPRAQAARRALLKRAADGNLRVYAVHFPFPGLGHVKAQGDAYVWVPEG